MSLRAPMVGWIVLAVLFLAPSAQAASFSGNLELASGTVLQGDIQWSGQTRVIELEAGRHVPAYSLELSAARATVWVQRDATPGTVEQLLGDSVSNGAQTPESLTDLTLTRLDVQRGGHITFDGSSLNTRAQTSAAMLEAAQEFYTSVDPADDQRFDEPALAYSIAVRDQILAHMENVAGIGAGTVRIALWNTHFDINSAEGPRSYRTGQWYESTSSGVLEQGERMQQIVWLELTDAHFTLQWDGAATVAGPSPTIDIDGLLRSDKAAGFLVLDNLGTSPFVDALHIRGQTTLHPTVDAKHAVRETNPTRERIQPYEAFDAGMNGDASAMSVSGRSLLAAAEVPLEYAAAGAAGVGLLALAYGAYRFLPVGLAAFYSRLEEGALLDNPTRAQIYTIIKANPGINARQVHRLASASWGTVVHHLGKLSAAGYVAARSHGRAKCYYENHGKWDAYQEQLAVLTGAKTEAIARAITSVPGRDQAQIVARTGFSQSTVSYHLLKLEKAGLVTHEQTVPATYFPTVALSDLSARLSHEIGPRAAVGGVA